MYKFLGTQNYQHHVSGEGLFNKDECEEIIRLGLENNLETGTIGGAPTEEYRNSKITWFTLTDKKYAWIYKKCEDISVSVNNEIWNYDLDAIEQIQFAMYDGTETQGHYKKHIDISPYYDRQRKISLSLQLSNDEEYTGGDLVVHNGKNTTLSRKQGTVNVFPSYVLHEVTPVTTGVRYSLVWWVVGPNFK